jgi:3-methyladenine DNA glycosylase AlkD
MTLAETLTHLKDLSSPQYLTGMARFGIDNTKALGVKVPDIRKLAKTIKKDHQLAQQLWDTGIHEAPVAGHYDSRPGASDARNDG